MPVPVTFPRVFPPTLPALKTLQHDFTALHSAANTLLYTKAGSQRNSNVCVGICDPRVLNGGCYVFTCVQRDACLLNEIRTNLAEHGAWIHANLRLFSSLFL